MVTVSREHQVIKRCVESIMEDAGKEAKALTHKALCTQSKALWKAKYNKRSYGQGSRMRPSDLYYLRLEEIRQKAKARMRRLRIADDLIDIYMDLNLLIRRKNSRGHSGVRHAR